MEWLPLSFLLTVLLPCTTPVSVNVARGKPTFQSSTGSDGVPSRAVDGNKNTNYFANSCTHTIGSAGTTNPWWAVDLQWSRLVDRVDITNRAGDSAHRLHNIRIGTTDVSPTTAAPTPTNINICASRDPAVASGATEQFTCGGQGRYLVILLEGNGKILTLCEVEVLASRKELNFAGSVNTRLVGHVIDTLEVRTVHHCSRGCLKNTQCSSFNVRSVTPGSMTCELNEDISEAQITAGLTTDPQYVFYQIIYQQ